MSDFLGSFTEFRCLYHVDYVPYEKKRYVCDICGTSTTNSNHFREHSMIHSDAEKPHKCTECDFATIYKRGLELHVLTHLRQKGIR